jgi:Fe-S cluster assembly protein SufD
LSLATAIRTGDVAQLPGKRDEDWRWTDLRGLIRVLPEASPSVDQELPASPFGVVTDDELAFVNGYALATQSYSAAAGESAVLALRFVSATEGTSHAAEATVLVPAGASLTVLESYEGLAGGYLAAAKVDFVVLEGGSLERIVLADDDAEAVSVSDAKVALSPGGRFAQTVVVGGARRQRIETRVVHPGGHASARLDGVYLLAGKRHADLTSVVEHQGIDGVTDQLTKGVVRDQARGVFQGRIVVAQGADRTDARMGHHALILSDRAEIDAKPELEIYADDVSCAHGNTVGALDEEALFYARQRGIPEAAARAMLTEAFIGEVVDRIEHEGAREAVRAWAAERLRS